MTKTFRYKKHSGMTLIELLCVIGILICLSTLLFPAFAQAKSAAKKSVCLSNLRSIYAASVLYGSDVDDLVPLGKDGADDLLPSTWPEPSRTTIKAMPKLSELLSPYAKSGDVWKCPLDSGLETLDVTPELPLHIEPSLFEASGMSYRYNTSMALAKRSFTSFEQPSKQYFFGDQGGHWHPGSTPLRVEYGLQGNLQLLPSLRYSVVFVDGHAERSLSYSQVYKTWATP